MNAKRRSGPEQEAMIKTIAASLVLNILGLYLNGYDAYFQEYTECRDDTDTGTTIEYTPMYNFFTFKGKDEVEGQGNIELMLNVLQIILNIAQLVLTASCCHHNVCVRCFSFLIAIMSTVVSVFTFLYTMVELNKIFVTLNAGRKELGFIFIQVFLNSCSIMFCYRRDEDEKYEDVEKAKLIDNEW